MAQFVPPKASHSTFWYVDCVSPREVTGRDCFVPLDFPPVIPFLAFDIPTVFVLAADFIYVLARRFHNNQIWLYLRVYSHPSFRSRTAHQAA